MQPDTQSARLPAVTLEDQNQLDYVGGEASAPGDMGLAVADEDRDHREDLTSVQLAAEASEDMVFSHEETGQ